MGVYGAGNYGRFYSFYCFSFSYKEMNLTDLPPEVLVTIFLYLRTKFVLNTVTRVCKLFYHIITPEATWKTRFGKIWPRRLTNNDSDCILPRLVYQLLLCAVDHSHQPVRTIM